MTDRPTSFPTFESVVYTGLRAIAASVPAAASISHAWTEWETSQQFTRLEDFIIQLRLQVERRQQELEGLAESLRQSEDVAPLLERAARAARLEPSDARRAAFAACLFELLLHLDTPLGDKLDIIEHLDHLTEQDLSVFLHIDGEGAWFNNIYDEIQVPKESRMSLLTSSLPKLVARGLLCDVPRKDAHGFDVVVSKINATYAYKYFAVLPAGQYLRDVVLAAGANPSPFTMQQDS